MTARRVVAAERRMPARPSRRTLHHLIEEPSVERVPGARLTAQHGLDLRQIVAVSRRHWALRTRGRRLHGGDANSVVHPRLLDDA